jgi:hypothetical protein
MDSLKGSRARRAKDRQHIPVSIFFTIKIAYQPEAFCSIPEKTGIVNEWVSCE